jgi:hypothetical protein
MLPMSYGLGFYAAFKKALSAKLGEHKQCLSVQRKSEWTEAGKAM